MTEVPVVLVDLDPRPARLLQIALNEIHGEWDEYLLARLLDDLAKPSDLDLTASGFDEQQIAGFLAQLEAHDKRDRPETFDAEEAFVPRTRAATTQPGDSYALGTPPASLW